MDNTEKVERAINDYLEKEDASFLDKIMGTVGTEPFGDSDLGYCIARGNLADVIARIKKITNFSDLLAEEIKLSNLKPEEQLEMTDKTVVTEKDANEVADSEGLVTEEFSEEGSIGNELTDGKSPEEQLELDNKVLIDTNADVDDIPNEDEDCVVATFSDLKFSETGDTISELTDLLTIAKEVKELEANSAAVPEDESDEDEVSEESELEEGDDEYEDSELEETEEFSLKDKFKANLQKELNFANKKVDQDLLKDLHGGIEKFVSKIHHAKSYEDVASVEKDFKKYLNLKLENYSEHIKKNFDETPINEEESKTELDSYGETFQKRLDSGVSTVVGETTKELLDNAKKNDGLFGKIGGASDAKKDKPILEAQMKAMTSKKNEDYNKEQLDIINKGKDKLKAAENNTSNSTSTDLTSLNVNSSFKEKFRSNLQKEFKNFNGK